MHCANQVKIFTGLTEAAKVLGVQESHFQSDGGDEGIRFDLVEDVLVVVVWIGLP